MDATAIAAEHYEAQMQEWIYLTEWKCAGFLEDLGYILQYYLDLAHIDYGSVNLNRMAVGVFHDMYLNLELKTAMLQMARERDEGLTGDDNAIDLRQDEEMINLTGDEDVIDLTGDEDVIDLTGDEVVDLTQHEDLTHFRSVRSASYGPPPPYSP
ncbi:hypothetical protein BCON_0083g00050 [Botryotinia convoluta]|uniref:Uncharacterized protein n=1 Tax=Botryotinia convoluta TaxID=54673 RepID=A0A4Z1IGY7_9HELO|nr:hypothetical protein BCON_0083g00050 [Botryotinia convoluta]